jgi:hypothetical protein
VRHVVVNAVLRGTWSVASDFGMCTFREFWPDLKRAIHRRH